MIKERVTQIYYYIVASFTLKIYSSCMCCIYNSVQYNTYGYSFFSKKKPLSFHASFCLITICIFIGNEYEVQRLLRNGANPNCANENGNSALMLAAKKGDHYL